MDLPTSCPDCAGMPQDYRSPAGHLELDPETGATVLAPHRPARTPRVMAFCIDGICATCDRPPCDHDMRYNGAIPVYFCLA